MLFNSIEYFLFLLFVFLVYWSLKNLKVQNCFLLIASYFFYGLWDFRFLSLIFISSLTDYFLSLKIVGSTSQRRRKTLLIASIVVNLGILGAFKYYKFFSNSLIELMGWLNMDVSFTTLNVVLPVGISFYTFQTMSYTIDVYRGKMEPTKNALNFFTYVAFFPQLVAGPIERASRLLPQLEKKRTFSYEQGRDGMRQILWGLFLKIVVGDSCAVFVDQIYANHTEMNAPMLLLGSVFFSFQIYGDFAGYSEIAIGTAKLLGIDLVKNFATPFYSRNLAELWRRWHISLMSWFRDYLYIPLGGSRDGLFMKTRNIFLIFLISGLWHGASWNRVIWGAIHGLLYIPLVLTGADRNHMDTVSFGSFGDGLVKFGKMLTTFLLFSFSLIVFRTESLASAWAYFGGFTRWESIDLSWLDQPLLLFTSGFVLIMLVAEWINRNEPFILNRVPKNPVLRYCFYILLVFLINQSFTESAEFFYFQF